MSKLYLNGKLCNGSGRGANEYKVEDLKMIAAKKGIYVPSKMKKEAICQMLLDSGVANSKNSTIVSKNTVSKNTVSKSPKQSMKVPVQEVAISSKNQKMESARSNTKVANNLDSKPKSRSKKKVTSKVDKSEKTKKIFNSIEELMNTYNIKEKDAIKLLGFSEAEMEELIEKMKMFDGKMTMSEYLRGTKGSERVKKFLITIAEKYCRCIKGSESKSVEGKRQYNPMAVCTSSIFSKKGLKGPGRAFQCEPVPLLLGKQNSVIVLEKK